MELKDQLRGISVQIWEVWENQQFFVQSQEQEGVEVLLRVLLKAEACLVSPRAVHKEFQIVTRVVCQVCSGESHALFIKHQQ